MAFNPENKVGWDQLSPSLQEKINGKASLSDFLNLQNRFNDIELLSGGVRLSIVSSLNNISSPINGKELAIVTADSVLTAYTYSGNKWVKIHAVYA